MCSRAIATKEVATEEPPHQTLNKRLSILQVIILIFAIMVIVDLFQQLVPGGCRQQTLSSRYTQEFSWGIENTDTSAAEMCEYKSNRKRTYKFVFSNTLKTPNHHER